MILTWVMILVPSAAFFAAMIWALFFSSKDSEARIVAQMTLAALVFAALVISLILGLSRLKGDKGDKGAAAKPAMELEK
jgi:hypothetical protein